MVPDLTIESSVVIGMQDLSKADSMGEAKLEDRYSVIFFIFNKLINVKSFV